MMINIDPKMVEEAVQAGKPWEVVRAVLEEIEDYIKHMESQPDFFGGKE